MSGLVITFATVAYLCTGFSIGLLIVGADAASSKPKVTNPLGLCVQWMFLWPGILVLLLIVAVVSIFIFGFKGEK